MVPSPRLYAQHPNSKQAIIIVYFLQNFLQFGINFLNLPFRVTSSIFAFSCKSCFMVRTLITVFAFVIVIKYLLCKSSVIHYDNASIELRSFVSYFVRESFQLLKTMLVASVSVFAFGVFTGREFYEELLFLSFPFSI